VAPGINPTVCDQVEYPPIADHKPNGGQCRVKKAENNKPPANRHGIEAMLRAAVESYSSDEHPRGCLIVLGAANCTRANERVRDHLRGFRLQLLKTIRRRLERGVKECDMTAGKDLNGLASFYTTFLHGLSIHARDGASKNSMDATVDYAMAAWDAM